MEIIIKYQSTACSKQARRHPIPSILVSELIKATIICCFFFNITPFVFFEHAYSDLKPFFSYIVYGTVFVREASLLPILNQFRGTDLEPLMEIPKGIKSGFQSV